MPFRSSIQESDPLFNFTPLVDVMFILLIFIIVTAQYANLQSLKVNLPKAETGVALEKTDEILITLTKEERLFLNDKPVTWEGLRNDLKPLAERSDPPRVILQADEGSTTGRLVKVMDYAQQVGLKKISIETKK